MAKGNKVLPFIPGIDVAGIVERVGSHVKNINPGQRVIAFPQNGSYAEYVVSNENLTFVLPDEVDFQTAAACPIVSFTSYNLLANVAKLQQGESVLIPCGCWWNWYYSYSTCKTIRGWKSYRYCRK